MHFQISERCPKCGKIMGIATVELDDKRPNRAFHTVQCACGFIRTKIVSIASGEGAPRTGDG